MPRRLIHCLIALLLAAALPAVHAQEQPPQPADTDFEHLAAQLPDADYARKRELITKIAATGKSAAKILITALLDGTLQSRDSDHQLFVVADSGDGYTLTDALTGAPAGHAPADGFTKIGTNNQLRKTLRNAIAQLDLANPDAAVRLAAVTEMLRGIDEEAASLLRGQVVREPDARVRKQMQVAIAIGDLEVSDPAKRLAAVESVQGSLNPEVYNRLKALVAVSDDGTAAEPDDAVRGAARDALKNIDRTRSLNAAVETLFFGLSLGSVLVLAGIGLAITFGVMGVINMAHGELMMLGAYTTYVVQLLMPHALGTALIVAIPAAFLVSGAVGVLIERGIVRFLYGRALETLLATFGVSLILQQLVRDVFSPNNRPVETPSFMAGSLQINEVLSITYTRLYIVLFTLVVFFVLLAVLKRTRLGLEVRAVSQNRAMARAMGIRTEWVDALTFGLGSGIAGIAGVALSQLTNVGPNLGQSYIVDSFMVVVFGGVGNLWGTQIGGTSLGVINKLLEPYAGAVLAKILVLVFLILFIQRRPRGLFPQKGRAAEG